MLIFCSVLASVLMLGFLFMHFAPQFGAAAKGKRLERMQQSPQYHQGKFENTSPTPMMTSSSLSQSLRMWRDFLVGVKGATPPHALPLQTRTTTDFAASALPAITWFGHSAVLLELDGQRILLDPMLGRRSSPLSFIGSKRFHDHLPIPIEELPPLDAIVFSHDHYDHLDYGSVLRLKHKTAHFFVPLGVGAHLERWGVPAEKITELDWWETASCRGITLTAAPARHFSGRGLFNRNSTLWCSWVLQGQQHKIYFGGDSGYDAHFAQIGERLGPFDVTLLECGQYNETWKYIHMMPEQTAQAHLDLRGKVLQPTHWAGFALALHPWQEPVQRLTKAAAQQGITLATPLIGQTWQVGAAVPQNRWWQELE